MTLSYISIEVFTRDREYFSNPLDDGVDDKNPFNIALNILSLLVDDNSGIQNILNYLNSLGVTLFLPPPGGAQAVTN